MSKSKQKHKNQFNNSFEGWNTVFCLQRKVFTPKVYFLFFPFSILSALPVAIATKLTTLLITLRNKNKIWKKKWTLQIRLLVAQLFIRIQHFSVILDDVKIFHFKFEVFSRKIFNIQKGILMYLPFCRNHLQPSPEFLCSFQVLHFLFLSLHSLQSHTHLLFFLRPEW